MREAKGVTAPQQQQQQQTTILPRSAFYVLLCCNLSLFVEAFRPSLPLSFYDSSVQQRRVQQRQGQHGGSSSSTSLSLFRESSSSLSSSKSDKNEPQKKKQQQQQKEGFQSSLSSKFHFDNTNNNNNKNNNGNYNAANNDNNNRINDANGFPNNNNNGQQQTSAAQQQQQKLTPYESPSQALQAQANAAQSSVSSQQQLQQQQPPPQQQQQASSNPQPSTSSQPKTFFVPLQPPVEPEESPASKERRLQPKLDSESLFEYTFPFIMPVIAYLTYEYVAVAYSDFVNWATSDASWYAVDGGALQAKIIAPAINGLVAPAIAILYATLTSTTISTLRQRQVDIRRCINMEAGELRNLGHLVYSYPVVTTTTPSPTGSLSTTTSNTAASPPTTVPALGDPTSSSAGPPSSTISTSSNSNSIRSMCRTYLIQYTKRIIRECQPPSGPFQALDSRIDPGHGMDTELNGFLIQMHQGYGRDIPAHLAGESFSAIARLRSYRLERITALQCTYPINHFILLALLALAECIAFLMETNQDVLFFLSAFSLKILWSLLVGTFAACFTVFYDFQSPFAGSYQISTSVDQLYFILKSLESFPSNGVVSPVNNSNGSSSSTASTIPPQSSQAPLNPTTTGGTASTIPNVPLPNGVNGDYTSSSYGLVNGNGNAAAGTLAVPPPINGAGSTSSNGAVFPTTAVAPEPKATFLQQQALINEYNNNSYNSRTNNNINTSNINSYQTNNNNSYQTNNNRGDNLSNQERAAFLAEHIRNTQQNIKNRGL